MDTLPENIPAHVRNLLRSITDGFEKALEGNLAGVYLHGSAAMGCFNPAKSDIDLLIVVHEKLSTEKKKEIIRFILLLADQAPQKGLELSVVTNEALQDFHYPTPYELHFSNAWKTAYLLDSVDYDKQRYDPDLAVHFAVTRKRGIRLYGKPVQSLFPDIPEEYYLRSIMGDAKDIFEGITDNPVYGILNLCRVLAFLKEKAIYSKLEGGNWGIQHVTPAYRPLIQAALRAYQSVSGNDAAWDTGDLKAFAKHMKQQIQMAQP